MAILCLAALGVPQAVADPFGFANDGSGNFYPD
jgi:hypothetical protein